MIRRIVSASRFLIVIAAAAIFLLAIALMLLGAAETYVLLAGVARGEGGKGIKAVLLAGIELVDLFLLATVFYVIGVGLYELFIDDQLTMPAWLAIHTLDDLKDKLISVIVVVMAVLFLSQLIAWDGQRDLLGYGAAVALVIAAISYFTGQKKAKRGAAPPGGDNDGH